MASTNYTSQWEVPKFSFSTANQAEEWNTIYVRALDYLETLDIDIEALNQIKKGWKHIKMMVGDEDGQALQTFIENGTITPWIQETPKLIINTIQTTINADENFWPYHNEIFSDLQQKPDGSIYSFSTHIIQLTNSCQFSKSDTKKALKIIILQHKVKYHKARDWFNLQDYSTLPYDKLLSHCRTLET